MPGRSATLVIAITVFAFIAGWVVAPHLDHSNAPSFDSLFATCAQVVAALLVVIAVEVTVTSFRGLDLRAGDVKLGLATGCISLIAAIAALSPSLPDGLYKLCLALAVSGGLGALATVLTLGGRAIGWRREEAELLALHRRAALGDGAAVEELLARGEPAPTPLVSPNPGRQGRPPRTGGA